LYGSSCECCGFHYGGGGDLCSSPSAGAGNCSCYKVYNSSMTVCLTTYCDPPITSTMRRECQEDWQCPRCF
jgi:hypothetical protein